MFLSRIGIIVLGDGVDCVFRYSSGNEFSFEWLPALDSRASVPAKNDLVQSGFGRSAGRGISGDLLGV